MRASKITPRPFFKFGARAKPNRQDWPSGDAPRLFGPEDGRLRDNLAVAIIRLSAQCPAAKLLVRPPEGGGTVPADNFSQPLLKEIELLEFTTILQLMKPAQGNNPARV